VLANKEKASNCTAILQGTSVKQGTLTTIGRSRITKMQGLFCNLSILLIWTLPEGFQIKEAYLTLERTKAEYTDNLEYGSLNNKVYRLTKPNIAYAFGNIKFRCSLNRNLLSNNTPCLRQKAV